jgi:superfamily II DNA or RNA helicase
MTTTQELLAEIQHLAAPAKWKNLCSDRHGNPSWGRWKTQHDAVNFAASYITRDKKHHEKAALIRMSTGTGKTGIMAIIANYLLRRTSCLLVVPSTYLTGQAMRVLNRGYWETVQKRPSHPVPAVVFLPSDLRRHLQQQSDATVFICTQKALADVYAMQSDYSALKARIGAVLVDEGHREPALTWSKAVRTLEKPTILFSATPYRNDLRMFRIGRGRDYRFAFRYQEALGQNLVRQVEFRNPNNSFFEVDRATGMPQRKVDTFAAELLSFYRQVLISRKPVSVITPRIIVRCDTAGSIENVQAALRRAIRAEAKPICGPELIIAIHETFNNQQSKQKFSRPPKPGDTGSDAVFWIHQFKMVEGIDNPEFCCVAFYERFSNARSLVQQVGRIIRNPSGSPKEVAFVFSDPRDAIEEEWRAYVEFEKTGQDIIGAEDIVHSIREAQPKWFYAGGKYRQGVEFDSDDYWTDIRIPASAQVYDRPSGQTRDYLTKLADKINERIEERDVAHVRTIAKHFAKSRASVTAFFWEVLQSEYLEVRGFFDVRLLVSHLYMNDKHIFYNGFVTPDSSILEGGPEKIAVENLLSAIPAKNAFLKEMALVNSDLGNMAVRRRNLGGRSLELSSAALNDHLHFVSACVCSYNGKRRYIGLSHARVTDSGAKLLSLDQYHQWADTLSGDLTTRKKQHNTILRRYAPAVRRPIAAKARHLLLDLNAFGDEFGNNRIVVDDGGVEAFEATACDVDASGDFQCVIAGRTVHGRITYSGGRFRITSSELDEMWKAKAGSRRSASSFLSSPEVIRIVTEDGLIYADGRFYRPLRLHGQGRLTDLDMFCEVPELHAITTGEKGTKGTIGSNTWESGSIFHVIDTSTNLFTNNDISPDILVCDDLSTEVADFVAIDTTGKKIVLLHAKEGSGAGGVSVSDLHVVVSQAKKNLAFFDAAEALPKKRGDKWDAPWRWKKRAAGNLQRIRKRPSPAWDGRKIIECIESMRFRTDTHKEVWLVLGNMFGKSDIKKVITSDENLRYHWIQMLYLIHACHASVAAVGARLRILVGP